MFNPLSASRPLYSTWPSCKPSLSYAMLHVATIQACSSFCLICYCANHREFIMILCTISNIVELSVSVVLFTSRIATGFMSTVSLCI